MNDLIQNLDKLHTTEMGEYRIKSNLSIKAGDVVRWCKAKIADPSALIEREGKNWYVSIDGYRITVNSHSYTIITAHLFDSEI